MVTLGPLEITELDEDHDQLQEEGASVRSFLASTYTHTGRKVELLIEVRRDERDNGDVNHVLVAQAGDMVIIRDADIYASVVYTLLPLNLYAFTIGGGAR